MYVKFECLRILERLVCITSLVATALAKEKPHRCAMWIFKFKTSPKFSEDTVSFGSLSVLVDFTLPHGKQGNKTGNYWAKKIIGNNTVKIWLTNIQCSKLSIFHNFFCYWHEFFPTLFQSVSWIPTWRGLFSMCTT